MEQGNVAENKKGNYPKAPKKYTDKEKSRLTYRPLAGYAYNPLLKLPRNMKCPCKSGLKFKKCCLTTLPPAIKKWEADKFNEYLPMIKKGEFIFDRKTNTIKSNDQA